jgi:hypothetical protein
MCKNGTVAVVTGLHRVGTLGFGEASSHLPLAGRPCRAKLRQQGAERAWTAVGRMCWISAGQSRQVIAEIRCRRTEVVLLRACTVTPRLSLPLPRPQTPPGSLLDAPEWHAGAELPNLPRADQ